MDPAVPDTKIIEATEEDMKDALREAVSLLESGEVDAVVVASPSAG